MLFRIYAVRFKRRYAVSYGKVDSIFNSQLNSSKDDESALEEINEIVFKKES